MQDALAIDLPDRKLRLHRAADWIRAQVPTLPEFSLAAGSALLLILSFPDFDLWPLAWIGLTPLLVVVVQTRSQARAFVLGWCWAALFFYGSCWWLTYPMIHYGHIAP